MIIALCIIVAASALVLAVSFVCYDMTFRMKKEKVSGDHDIGRWADTEEKVNRSRELFDYSTSLSYEDVYTTSIDGLKLHARYLEGRADAPLAIMFHGYFGNALRDMAGTVRYAKERGINVLLTDHRAHGGSEGRSVCFGVKERYDVKSWVDYASERFGKEQKILLMGISMGAAAVLMSSSLELGENVKAIMADCAYSSPEEEIRYVMKQLHYPVFLFPLVRLGGLIYGGFDICSSAPERELKANTRPVLLVHGESDSFVPAYMTEKNSLAAGERAKVYLFPGADHGMSFLTDPERYIKMLDDFIKECTGYIPEVEAKPTDAE